MYDENFRIVFEAIKQLLETDTKPRRKIGFGVKEGRAVYGKKHRKQKTGGKKA